MIELVNVKSSPARVVHMMGIFTAMIQLFINCTDGLEVMYISTNTGTVAISRSAFINQVKINESFMITTPYSLSDTQS
jgi:hypothetical protein